MLCLLNEKKALKYLVQGPGVRKNLSFSYRVIHQNTVKNHVKDKYVYLFKLNFQQTKQMKKETQ